MSITIEATEAIAHLDRVYINDIINLRSPSTTTTQGTTMDAKEKPQVEVFGQKTVLNVWSRANMLLQTLYRDGVLPNVFIAFDEVLDQYTINGVHAGRTDETVQNTVWKMVESWEKHGYLAEDNEQYERELKFSNAHA
ncbi:hypothetical protein A9R05_42845 (plasmid) [Burkholderia sp. KK1]|nr:hypothetical protein A9R05_42845 [Burkholderia sp. KK1]